MSEERKRASLSVSSLTFSGLEWHGEKENSKVIEADVMPGNVPIMPNLHGIPDRWAFDFALER